MGGHEWRWVSDHPGCRELGNDPLLQRGKHFRLHPGSIGGSIAVYIPGAIFLAGSPTITNNIIRYKFNYGIYVSGGSSVITDNQISDSSGVVCISGTPSVTGNDLYEYLLGWTLAVRDTPITGQYPYK